MENALKIIPVGLYFIVGIISLVMAWKSLFSSGFISFHEEAAGISLENIDPKIQNVILALMKTTGLGFLVVGLLLMVFPVVNFFKSDGIIQFGIPIVCGIYCLGLFLANYQLHKKSGVETPWKGSLIAVIILLAGIIVSIL